MKAVVIGAGISGLYAACRLKKEGFEVTLLEKDSSPGGTMKTLREQGWMVEQGPNSALETTPLFATLFEELGFGDERIYADPSAARRYILRQGRLHPLPAGPGSFLTSRLWSVGGKLRLLKEPLVGRAAKEESVAEFVTRRLGREFLDYAVNPFVAGVFAGDPRRLSVQSAFPKLFALEENYGGLVKGMIGSRKERRRRQEVAKDRAKMFSFREGMQTLPDRLAASLGPDVQLNAEVERIVPVRAGRFPLHVVSYRSGESSATIEANVLVLATPAYAAAPLLRGIDPAMAGMLESIAYPPVAEVFLGFREEQVGIPLDGFGFLVPEKERRNILGTIWSSALFPGRAPARHAALTTFVGGARQPSLARGSDEELSDLVCAELKSLMRTEGAPVYRKVIRWERAIPQYEVGYYKVLQAIERFEQNFRGAFICANYRGGISVGDCLMSAEKRVGAILIYREAQRAPGAA